MMPTVTYRIREKSNLTGKSISFYVAAPQVKNIIAIRMRRTGTATEYTPTNMTSSVDISNQRIHITGGYNSTSSTTTYTQPKLTGSTVSGNTRTCRYEGGHTRQIPATGNCGGFITISTTIHNFDYDVEVEYGVNTPPMIASDTPDLDALYEGDTYTIDAEVNEPDMDDTINVYYQVNDDVPQVFGFFTSESEPLFASRGFTYRNGQLVDDVSQHAVDVPEGSLHTIKMWAEDDYGGMSDVLEKEFTVDSNQPPQVTVNPFTNMPFLLADEQIAITGAAMDPNGGEYKLSYRLDEGQWFDTYEGTDSPFSIALPLPLLKENSVLQIRAVDEFDAADEQIVDIEKELVRYPLLKSDIRYRINIPSRTAQIITLKVMREIGDLTVTANVSMTGGESDELFVAMTKTGTQAAGEGMEEDTFSYTATEPMEKILFQIVMERQDVSSTAKVRRVTGTLN